jgi:CAAX prenyl protease-like protein
MPAPPKDNSGRLPRRRLPKSGCGRHGVPAVVSPHAMSEVDESARDGTARPAIDYATPAPKKSSRVARDDLAYIAPMAVFLAFNFIASTDRVRHGIPHGFAITYGVKTVVVAILLFALRHHYTKIRWNHWWLGVIVGVVGIFQWVGMQIWLQHHVAWFRPSGGAFDPTQDFSTTAGFYTFVVVRLIGAVLVVPVMEELFWRDFLWRQVISPNDFKLPKVGEFEWPAVLIVSGAFALVHGNWWLTSIGWALMIAFLLVYTKSLGACIIAHGTTNLLLGIYVLHTHDWSFW